MSTPNPAACAETRRAKDCTDLPSLEGLLGGGARIACYAGFDPTAGSLHVGHLATLAVLRDFAQRGHRVIAVIGTATAMIGDPTGRSEARPLMDAARIEENARGIGESIRRGMDPFGDVVEFRRNGEWFEDMGWIAFLRDVGRLVPAGRVLALEGIKTRLEGDGLTFLELAYPLMQAFDFLTLAREVGPLVQVGGSDQWGNIVAGLDLIRRAGVQSPAFGLTHPLLTRADGTKMGKTAGGAVWLNPAQLADFEFFRFWRTLADADAAAVARLVCDMDAPATVSGADAERFKEALAMHMTGRVRGHGSAAASLAASRSRGQDPAGLPEVLLDPGQAVGDLAPVMVSAGLAPSLSAARRLAAQGGVRVNGEARSDTRFAEGDFRDGVAVLSAGRTRHVAVRLALPAS